MKTFFKTILLLFIITVISGCSKDDDKGIESLPPATQTGARTFGCLVDGNAFVDTGVINCFYQYTDGNYHFGIQCQDEELDPFGIVIKSLGTIEQDVTYTLNHENTWGGGYFKYPQPGGSLVRTSSLFTGELSITKLDYENNIVSGTFWFDVEHPETGERVEIREGRFDTYFSQ